ncbi:MAG: hypothetical protein V2A56_12250 [bacterium]
MKILKPVLIWILSVLLASLMMVYQRTTGPTYPYHGKAIIDGESYSYQLLRSHELAPDENGSLDHTVRLAIEDTVVTGILFFKRLSIDEPFTAIAMARDGDELVATLPHQPAAGKLVYHVTLNRREETVDLPAPGKTVTIRFKGAVPLGVLLPHIFAMVLVMIFSVRAALAALFREKVRPLALATLIILVVGGFILGPLVQKFAFNAYWTGWPFGEDLTDNKTLTAVIAWVVALIMLRGPDGEKRGRWWSVVAAIVVLAVYSIPHSMGGSTFDYSSGQIVTGTGAIPAETAAPADTVEPAMPVK